MNYRKTQSAIKELEQHVKNLERKFDLIQKKEQPYHRQISSRKESTLTDESEKLFTSSHDPSKGPPRERTSSVLKGAEEVSNFDFLKISFYFSP